MGKTCLDRIRESHEPSVVPLQSERVSRSAALLCTEVLLQCSPPWSWIFCVFCVFFVVCEWKSAHSRRAVVEGPFAWQRARMDVLATFSRFCCVRGDLKGPATPRDVNLGGSLQPNSCRPSVWNLCCRPSVRARKHSTLVGTVPPPPAPHEAPGATFDYLNFSFSGIRPALPT